MPPPHSAGPVMGLTARQDGDAFVLAVSGDLDLENTGPLTTAVTEAGESARGPVVLDLSGVTFADSTTVNVLLQAYRALGGRLRLAAPSAFVKRLFDVIGLWEALPVHDSVESALAAPVPADTAEGSAPAVSDSGE
ncbi:STAS domain-containing protein [Streptomyces sp. NPDC088725]|uniref:STAS domain-containing protein n=1 Tax=Streptomyces sp. NPDC088725 TaxID=3365873 RepID=UPI0037FDE3C5